MADLINTAPRINSNRKAPKFLNLNNTTASWLYRRLVTHFVRNSYFMFKNFFQITHSFKLPTFLIQIFNSMLGTQNEIFFHLKIVNDVNRKYCTTITYKEEKTWSYRLCAIIAPKPYLPIHFFIYYLINGLLGGVKSCVLPKY